MVDKMNKESRTVLNQALLVLEHAMELAVEKEDLETMIAISDRLMMLYQHLSDKGAKKFKAGFAFADKEEVIKDEQPDER
jgi:hypothetical protein